MSFVPSTVDLTSLGLYVSGGPLSLFACWSLGQEDKEAEGMTENILSF